ncbi:MAG: 3-deoxy-7-phosphoheptulonate synthase class II [Phycisphaerales bacterium]
MSSPTSPAPARVDWSPERWRNLPTPQQPAWPDQAALDRALGELRRLPPLVTSWEIESLKSQLAEAARGQRFLLQGGDCCEQFDECESGAIAAKLKILLQMSLVLVNGARKRIIRVGRFAGQYAKPRTSDVESRDGVTLPAYRGDNVNRPGFTAGERTPDPRLLVEGYSRAALTLNFIRSLIDGGFADLHHPEYWDLEFVKHSPLAGEYQRMVEQIGESLRFMETLAGTQAGQINRVDFFTSHEALILHYEEALTRRVPHRTGWYDLSTHFPWIGLRTLVRGGGHLEFVRGIENPVGLKIGPGVTPELLRYAMETVDPAGEPGRITLIHRFGAHQVARELPPLIEEVQRLGRQPLWVCDPMHGNTETVTPASGAGRGVPVKTRKFAHILAELEQAFEIHRARGTWLGGVHFELTGEDVTECTGGARGLGDEHLARAYRSRVDPRLNYEQSLEMAMLIARRMRGA